MKIARKTVAAMAMTAVVGMMLLACTNGNTDGGLTGTEAGNRTAADTAAKQESHERTSSSEKAATRVYNDYKGHAVTIPAAPKRVIFAGETTGDLIELGIPLVGIFGNNLEGRIYQKEAAKIENVGFPISLEKVVSLNPDLILVASTDENAYAQLAKIAPTIMFDTFAGLDTRMKELGLIFDKQKETADWLQSYNAKAEEMWKKLYATVLKPGETASVFTFYPGDRLFVMARAGLPQMLYGEGGLKPTAPIREVLDSNQGFRQISAEAIGDFAGDRIFILDPVADEAKQSTEKLLNSPVWKNLPAVKNGHVYRMYIQKSDSDAVTRKWMLEELPRMLAK
ncbi:ferrichrome ABC transporter substrate-binding protein [Paenibacillus hemerocallicola]|uniref:Ferrichrome ABC transporter substrate-binding protein n=1 Tax=Paenibacillus hemerocallicola TaxID=1172614 RepID=A0A5C4TFF3_9BACL|nr:ABC transporter substrate-binding protein [Paenibacillus hemerocallicola]TNJ67705.1 ferrichrome ABC transporter substrate-binding protein [Paenibacillus hemerocallicola]